MAEKSLDPPDLVMPPGLGLPTQLELSMNSFTASKPKSELVSELESELESDHDESEIVSAEVELKSELDKEIEESRLVSTEEADDTAMRRRTSALVNVFILRFG